MEEREIINGNKLIAEFMGLRKDHTHGWLENNEQDSWSYRDDLYLQYHTSWDWLMPVVEKIEGLGKEFTIKECSAYINGGTLNGHFGEKSKIEATYLTVVKFITWHNTNNK